MPHLAASILHRLPRPLLIAGGLFALAATGCGGSEACDVPHLVEDQVRGVEVVDCGTVEVDLVVDRDQAAALKKARDCVVATRNDQASFTFVWSSWGLDSLVTRAYVGIAAEEDYQIFSYSHDDFLGRTTVRRRTCADLATRPDCSDPDSLRDDLCLDCEDQGDVERFCHEP